MATSEDHSRRRALAASGVTTAATTMEQRSFPVLEGAPPEPLQMADIEMVMKEE